MLSASASHRRPAPASSSQRHPPAGESAARRLEPAPPAGSCKRPSTVFGRLGGPGHQRRLLILRGRRPTVSRRSAWPYPGARPALTRPVMPRAANAGQQQGEAASTAESAVHPGRPERPAEHETARGTRGSGLGRPIGDRRAGPWRPACRHHPDPGIRAGLEDGPPAQDTGGPAPGIGCGAGHGGTGARHGMRRRRDRRPAGPAQAGPAPGRGCGPSSRGPPGPPARAGDPSGAPEPASGCTPHRIDTVLPSAARKATIRPCIRRRPFADRG